VDTINGVAIILFDTGVVAVTIQSSIQAMRLQQGFGIWHKKSLIGLLNNQGEIVSQ